MSWTKFICSLNQSATYIQCVDEFLVSFGSQPVALLVLGVGNTSVLAREQLGRFRSHVGKSRPGRDQVSEGLPELGQVLGVRGVLVDRVQVL